MRVRSTAEASVLRRILLLLAIAAASAGCGSQESAGDRTPGPGGPSPGSLAELTEGNSLAPETALRARTAVIAAAPEMSSGAFANLRSGRDGATCGEVAPLLPDGSPGAPRPFIVTAEGAALISNAPGLNLRDPDDSFPEAYMEWCASTEELRAMAEQMAGAVPASGNEMSSTLPLPEPPPELEPIDLPRPEPAPQPAPAPDGPVQNFSDAVMRANDRR